jgi:hypothetical protein
MARNQNINELAALLQGSPAIQGPQPMGGGGVNVAPTDVTGAYGLASGLAQGNYAQQMGQQNAALGGLANLGGTAILANAMSDVRLKTEIKKVGSFKDHNLYAYNYIWGGPRQIGVMAQEVIKKVPEAVMEIGGYLAVDYSKLWRSA